MFLIDGTRISCFENVNNKHRVTLPVRTLICEKKLNETSKVTSNGRLVHVTYSTRAGYAIRLQISLFFQQGTAVLDFDNLFNETRVTLDPLSRVLIILRQYHTDPLYKRLESAWLELNDEGAFENIVTIENRLRLRIHPQAYNLQRV